MRHSSIRITRIIYLCGILLLSLRLLSACDSSEAQPCEEAVPTPEAGAFAVQVRSGGNCSLYQGEARFNNRRMTGFEGKPIIFANMSVRGGEHAPEFFLLSPVVELPEGTYGIADLSASRHCEMRAGKVSVGGTYVVGDQQAFSTGGSFVVHASDTSHVAASFEATVKLKGGGQAYLSGRLKARYSKHVAYTSFWN